MAKTIFQVKADIIGREEIAPGVINLTLVSPEIARDARPGQFVHILCSDPNSNYILRRPFSIHKVVPGRVFEILFQIAGKGTDALSKLKVHDTVDVIGPLGHSFKYSEDVRSALLIGGGLGVAPLLFLAEELMERNVLMYSMLGAQTRDKMFRYIDFKRMSKKTYAATDDGSFGHHGTVVELLNRTVHQIRPEVIYACGPEPMLKKIARTADDFAIICQVSLETKMACGIGACLGCAVATKDGYKMTCKDGPVFNANDLIWDLSRGRDQGHSAGRDESEKAKASHKS
ncbi:MAG TPA: dihydroorotate dehydrogenase electron transfer subunit [Candidatus Aquicultor sp.]|jgi:dihydroorotate dehydrogenase electron transfer subunit